MWWNVNRIVLYFDGGPLCYRVYLKKASLRIFEQLKIIIKKLQIWFISLPINGTSGYVFINSLNINGGGTGSISRRVSSYIAHQQFFMNNTIVVNIYNIMPTLIMSTALINNIILRNVKVHFSNNYLVYYKYLKVLRLTESNNDVTD